MIFADTKFLPSQMLSSPTVNLCFSGHGLLFFASGGSLCTYYGTAEVGLPSLSLALSNYRNRDPTSPCYRSTQTSLNQ